MLTVLLAVAVLGAVVAVPTVWAVRRGRAAGIGRVLRVAAFVLAVAPASFPALTTDSAAYQDLRFFIPAFVVPALVAAVPAALPRSGSTVAPLTTGAAAVLFYWTAVSSLIGIGLLYWPATAVLIIAAIVETTRRPRSNNAHPRQPHTDTRRPPYLTQKERGSKA